MIYPYYVCISIGLHVYVFMMLRFQQCFQLALDLSGVFLLFFQTQNLVSVWFRFTKNYFKLSKSFQLLTLDIFSWCVFPAESWQMFNSAWVQALNAGELSLIAIH